MKKTVEVARQAADLRTQLVEKALEWESYFGIGPGITTVVSEWDAAQLVGVPEEAYCAYGQGHPAVTTGLDFEWKGIRYQVTANRPSGKKGSRVTLVKQKTEKKKPFGWDRLIWILYDRAYVMQEAWEFTAEEYRTRFSHKTRLSPKDPRQGRCLFSLATNADIMLENVEVNGEKAIAAYLRNDDTPATKEDYDLVRLVFEDGRVVVAYRQLESRTQVSSPATY